MRTRLTNKNKQQTLVSIILPVYNAEKTIKRAIFSIINQTYINWELILIDDGSKDNTTKIIRNIIDIRIKKYNLIINKGLVHCLNMGINLSKGSFIARMDADDICFPERLECQLNFLKRNNNFDLVGSQKLIFDENTKKVIRIYPKKEKKYLANSYYFSYIIPHPTWMVRTDWLKQRLYHYNNIYSEDQELLLRGASSSNYFLIGKPLLLYSESQISLSKKIKSSINIFLKKAKSYKKNQNLTYFFITCDVLFLFIKIMYYLSQSILQKNDFINFRNKKIITSLEMQKLIDGN